MHTTPLPPCVDPRFDNGTGLVPAMLARNFRQVALLISDEYSLTSRAGFCSPKQSLPSFETLYFDVLERCQFHPTELLKLVALLPITGRTIELERRRYMARSKAIKHGANQCELVPTYMNGIEHALDEISPGETWLTSFCPNIFLRSYTRDSFQDVIIRSRFYDIEFPSCASPYKLLVKRGLPESFERASGRLHNPISPELHVIEQRDMPSIASSAVLTEVLCNGTSIPDPGAPLIHQFWLPHPRKRSVEMPDELMNNVISNKRAIEAGSLLPWQFIMWSTDWSMLPQTRNSLAEHGFTLRNLADINPKPNILHYVELLTSHGLVGVAKDAAMYTVMPRFGGIGIDCDVRVDPYLADAFFNRTSYASAGLNGAFRAAPGHPFFASLLSRMEALLQDSYTQLMLENSENIEVASKLTTLFFSLFQNALAVFAESSDREVAREVIFGDMDVIKCDSMAITLPRLLIGSEAHHGSLTYVA